MDAEFWDERYGGREQLFSGNPNGVLVTEVADLAPGQALDVGCGEGGDALWLARRGWRVTAVDISRVALARATAAADAELAPAPVAGAELAEPVALDRATAAAWVVAPRIAWTRADLTVAPPPAGSFDLVSVQYFPLPRQPDHAALRRLLAAVAPGGTLLVGRARSGGSAARARHRVRSGRFLPAGRDRRVARRGLDRAGRTRRGRAPHPRRRAPTTCTTRCCGRGGTRDRLGYRSMASPTGWRCAASRSIVES